MVINTEISVVILVRKDLHSKMGSRVRYSKYRAADPAYSQACDAITQTKNFSIAGTALKK